MFRFREQASLYVTHACLKFRPGSNTSCANKDALFDLTPAPNSGIKISMAMLEGSLRPTSPAELPGATPRPADVSDNIRAPGRVHVPLLLAIFASSLGQPLDAGRFHLCIAV